MDFKAFVDTRLPGLAASYRRCRDRRLAARWRVEKVSLGFDMLGKPLMDQGRYDSGELPLFLELLSSTDVFLDIGANCGLFTLTAASRGVQAVAVEPNVENLDALMKNVRRNNFSGIEVLPLALSDEVDVRPLFGGGEGASLSKGWGGISSNYSRLVATNTIDNLFASRFAGRRVLIKMDVEGNEYNVLRGASALLGLDPPPVWMIEHGFKENHADKANPRFYDLFELLWDRGYKCVTADTARQVVSESDVLRWIQQGERDFGFINYLFFR